MLERELYEPVKNWLEGMGYTPRAEVCGCDIMALKDEAVIVVELKTTLNLDVILQATERQRFSDTVYIAVPKKGKVLYTKRWRMICHLLRRLELGLLLVNMKTGKGLVEEAIEPVQFDRAKSRSQAKRRRSVLVKEYENRHGSYNIGGINKVKLVTVYRELSLQIAQLLSVHGPLKPKALRMLGADSKKTQGILSNNHYGWFEKVSTGVYALSAKGTEALQTYSHMINDITQATSKVESQEPVHRSVNKRTTAKSKQNGA